jgi:ribosomal protein L30/L7E
MIAVVRLRGRVNMNKRNEYALKLLGLKKTFDANIVSDEKKGMLKKVDGFVTWGEVPDDFKIEKKLHPPKGGFKSLKKKYPKGDLGYRGNNIIDLIKRMSE